MNNPKQATVEKRIGDLVIYKNNQLIAFNKPPGIGVQQDKTGDKSLLDLAEIYCKSKLHLIHRLDRPASGIVLFAKTPQALAHLNAQFQQRHVRKTYLAVVGNLPHPAKGSLRHYLLKQPATNRSIAQEQETPGSKMAELQYQLLNSSERYHLLQIDLITGRHHQIRAQLSAVGSPVKGDVKYGFRRGNRDRSIHLHAWQLRFQHPVNGQKVFLTAQPPADSLWEAFKISAESKKS